MPFVDLVMPGRNLKVEFNFHFSTFRSTYGKPVIMTRGSDFEPEGKNLRPYPAVRLTSPVMPLGLSVGS